MRLPHLALVFLVVAGSAGCTRKVAVTTPTTRTSVSLRVTNNSSQSVTVVIQSAGTDYTVGTVSANTTSVLTVPQVAAGSTVRLRATLADGSRSYTRDGVVITGTFDWVVP